MFRPSFTRVAAGVLACTAAACSPTLDWRQFTPPDSGLSVTFPCRPDRQARAVVLGGSRLRMEMLACSAGGMTFALAFSDVTDATSVGSELAALRSAAVANVAGGVPSARPHDVAGMTPHQESGRLSVGGRLPDGREIREHALFFSRGLRIYQATVIGPDPALAAVDTFFGGFAFPP